MYKLITLVFILLTLFIYDGVSLQESLHNDTIYYISKNEAKLNNLNLTHKVEKLEERLINQKELYTRDLEYLKMELVESKITFWDYVIGIGIVLAILSTLWFFITKNTIPTVVKKRIKKKAIPIIEKLATEIVSAEGGKLVEKEIKVLRISIDEKIANYKIQEESSVVSNEQNISLPSEVSNETNREGHISTNLLFKLAFNTKSIRNKIALYKRVISEDKSHFYAANNLGVLFQEQGEYEKSIDYFDLSISINPMYHLPYINKAESLTILSKYEEALFDVEKGIELLPTYENGYFIKSKILLITNHKDKAFKNMEDVINKYHSNAILLHDNGYLHYLNHDYDDAIKNYLKASELNYPYMVLLLNNLAVCYRKKREYKLALDYLEKAKSFNNNYPLIYGTTALIYADQEDDVNFYKYIRISLQYGCPIWKFLEDPGFDKYRDQVQLIELIELFKGLDRDTLNV